MSVGALCYAELATTYLNVGGTYYYLKRAFGHPVGFLFAWARMTVIQTGSIALFAFIFGDYASGFFPVGMYSSSIYAVVAIIFFTALNIFGLYPSKWIQNFLTTAKVLGILLIVVIGITSPAPPTSTYNEAFDTWGMAMIFVLLSYAGWNEAAV